MRKATALIMILALLLCGCAVDPQQTSEPAPSSVIQPSDKPSAQPSDEQLPTERAKEIEELLRDNCTLNGEPLKVTVFEIEDDEGREDFDCASEGYPLWVVKDAEDFAPVFEIEPIDTRIWYMGPVATDHSGPIDSNEYTFKLGWNSYTVYAEYEFEDGIHAYVHCHGKVRVLDDAALTLSADTVRQGDLLPVVVSGRLMPGESSDVLCYAEEEDTLFDTFDYELYLPHTDSTQPMVARDGDRLYAVAQISVAAEPGDYTMELRRSKDGGDPEVIATADYHIEAREFDRQDLVTSSSTQSIYTSSNLSSDNEKMRAARSDSNPQPYFKGLFSCPLPDGWVLTTEFGQQRYVAGKFQSRHAARDMAAPLGTDVYATAPGKVTFAGELIVSGNTIVIDHGAGIFSSYSHLNEIGVEEGDFVEQGATIGKVGSTGYSTGPHLHFGLVASGYYVDPLYPQEHDLLAVLNPSEE